MRLDVSAEALHVDLNKYSLRCADRISHQIPISSIMKIPVFGKITSLCLLLAAGTMLTRADVLTWDPAANGSGSGGAGTWNLNGTANWFNGTADVKWLDNSAAGTNSGIFAG